MQPSLPGGTSSGHSSQRLLSIATGYRHRESGALTNVGTEGDVWSSSSAYAGNRNAGNLYFNSGNVNPLNNTNRANGLSVRCVQHLHRAVFYLYEVAGTAPAADLPFFVPTASLIRNGRGYGSCQRDR